MSKKKSTTLPLDALLRRMARMAEKIFNETGEVPLMWLVENAAGEQMILVTPVTGAPHMTLQQFKEKLDAHLREQFKAIGVVRYAHAAEVWCLAQGLEDRT